MHTPFHSRGASWQNRAKPKGPVRRNTISSEVAAPTCKRGFVMPKFLGLVRPHAPVQRLRGMAGATRKDVRTAELVFLTAMLHQLRVETQMVVLLTRSGAKTMSTTTAIRAAASTPAMGTADPIQLHADAHNALSMAMFYLRQPAANVPGARRKAVQALTALRGLSLALEG